MKNMTEIELVTKMQKGMDQLKKEAKVIKSGYDFHRVRTEAFSEMVKRLPEPYRTWASDILANGEVASWRDNPPVFPVVIEVRGGAVESISSTTEDPPLQITIIDHDNGETGDLPIDVTPMMPESILVQQAMIVAEKTDEQVKAKIELDLGEPKYLTFQFILYNDFEEIVLFSMARQHRLHNWKDFYPVTIKPHHAMKTDDRYIIASSQDALAHILEKIFSSAISRNAIDLLGGNQ